MQPERNMCEKSNKMQIEHFKIKMVFKPPFCYIS